MLALLIAQKNNATIATPQATGAMLPTMAKLRSCRDLVFGSRFITISAKMNEPSNGIAKAIRPAAAITLLPAMLQGDDLPSENTASPTPAGPLHTPQTIDSSAYVLVRGTGLA